MAIEPVTREERFLAAAGGQSVTPPAPITRKEQLLQGIIDAVKSGGATPDVIEGVVNDYLNANPVQPGATTEQAAQIEQNKNDIADLQTEVDELKESGGNGSGQNVALTTAQINTLAAVVNAIDAFAATNGQELIDNFNAAWGISGGDTGGGDSGGEEMPDEPDQPGGEGGGTTGDALPTDGLMAYFDLRNLGDKANVAVGATKGVRATQGSGALFSWAPQAIDSSDGYGVKASRGMMFSAEGNTTQTDLGTEFTVISLGYGECIGPGIEPTNVNPLWMLKPKYNTAGGTANATAIQGSELNGDDMKGYNFAVYRVSGAALTIINDSSRKDYNGSDYEGFASWDSMPFVGRAGHGAGYGTAVAIYNRAVSDVEIEEARAFMKTLEVSV